MRAYATYVGTFEMVSRQYRVYLVSGDSDPDIQYDRVSNLTPRQRRRRETIASTAGLSPRAFGTVDWVLQEVFISASSADSEWVLAHELGHIIVFHTHQTQYDESMANAAATAVLNLTRRAVFAALTHEADQPSYAILYR